MAYVENANEKTMNYFDKDLSKRFLGKSFMTLFYIAKYQMQSN